jgi:hypothetical protein
MPNASGTAGHVHVVSADSLDMPHAAEQRASLVCTCRTHYVVVTAAT